MINFDYIRVTTPKAAVDALVMDSTAQWIAGGTNLVDLMKKGVFAPEKLVDINKLALKEIKKQGSNLLIGALALNSEVADNDLVPTNNHCFLWRSRPALHNRSETWPPCSLFTTVVFFIRYFLQPCHYTLFCFG